MRFHYAHLLDRDHDAKSKSFTRKCVFYAAFYPLAMESKDNKKGGKTITENNYGYIFDRQMKSGTSWRCSNRKCKGRLHLAFVNNVKKRMKHAVCISFYSKSYIKRKSMEMIVSIALKSNTKPETCIREAETES